MNLQKYGTLNKADTIWETEVKCLRIFPDLHFHKIFVKNFIFRFGLKINCWKCNYNHLIVKILLSIFLMSELLNILNSLYSELSYNTHVCINGKPKGMELSQYWTKSECWHMKSSIFNNNIHIDTSGSPYFKYMAN